jgi:hypothetical protein
MALWGAGSSLRDELQGFDESPSFCLTPISNEHFPNTAAIFMWTDGQNSDSLAGQTIWSKAKRVVYIQGGLLKKCTEKSRGEFMYKRAWYNFLVFVYIKNVGRIEILFEQEFMATVASLGGNIRRSNWVDNFLFHNP